MTREEIVRLLQMMRSAYPQAKIEDPKGLVMAWELAFGEDEAKTIYQSARVHMNTSPFFPTVADIRKKMIRGDIVFGEKESTKEKTLPPPSAPMVTIDPTTSFCDLCGLCDRKIQELCEF